TEAFNYHFVDQDGKEKPIYMGCYGIGSSRIMGIIIEKHHDNHGIILPESVAPFQVHLIGLDMKDKNISSKVHQVYQVLKEKNIEVLFDDREEVSAGEKFADADLIGISVRLVVSIRTKEKVEYKRRGENKTSLMELKEVISNVKSQISNLHRKT
ncbi:hypothetical protein CO007_05885, partial [Candidatus Roizmanbacteria bacterium CG_4_8_14_3_um_filter_36_10]